jgi:dTDP-4-amino-4,6-dideoxygalactose transaminase
MKNIEIPYENLKKVNEPYFEEFSKVSKEVIENGWYVLGSNVSTFEQKFAELHNTNFCIGVASGLDALILGLAVFDFPKGSKVLVPSNTYIASILAILRADLIPILIEPNEHTYNIDLAGLTNGYTSDCVAILAVHLYGRLCPMVEISLFAKEKGLKIIEDCAQSHFAELNGVKAGTFGDIGAFSFYPTKNLGALGDAGAIICKDVVIYEKLKALRNYGSELKYYNKFIGWNSRLDEIQAAFLNIKLKDTKRVIGHKRNLATIYLKELAVVSDLILPQTANENNVWHIFNILSSKRDELKKILLINGIATEIHYPVSPNNQEGYQKLFLKKKYPISEKIHSSTLSLPISTCHNEEDVYFVCKKIIEFYSK